MFLIIFLFKIIFLYEKNFNNDWNDIKRGIEAVCNKFPDSYWQNLDNSRSYPTEFVDTLTKSGYLNVLIPEKYGSAGLPLRAASVILEEIHRCGANGAACHAQMYIMGSLLKHGSEELKQKYLPDIANGKIRLQAFGVTEPSSGSDTLSIKTSGKKSGSKFVINGQKVWTSRAEHSDLILLLTKTDSLAEKKKTYHCFL